MAYEFFDMNATGDVVTIDNCIITDDDDDKVVLRERIICTALNDTVVKPVSISTVEKGILTSSTIFEPKRRILILTEFGHGFSIEDTKELTDSYDNMIKYVKTICSKFNLDLIE